MNGRVVLRNMGIGLLGAAAVAAPSIADSLQQVSAVDAALAWRDSLIQRAPVLLPAGSTEQAILILADPPAASATPGERAARAAAISRRQEELVPVLAQLGAQVTHRYRMLVNGLAVRVSTGNLPAVAALAEVEAVVPVMYLAPAGVGEEGDGAARDVRDAARPVAGRAPAHLALIDTGIDVTHPWLGGGIGPTSPVLGGADLVDGDADPTDTSPQAAHGTAMASLVLRGEALRDLPPERVPRLLAYRVVGEEPVDGGRTMQLARSDNVLAAMEKAVDPNGDGSAADRSDVLLLGVSRAFGGTGLDPLERAARSADRLGAVVVAPAGNEGPTNAATGSVGGPAAVPTVLTVGALAATTTPRTARLAIEIGPAGANIEPLPLMGSAPPVQSAPVVLVPGADGVASGNAPEEFRNPDGSSRVQGAIAVVGRGGGMLSEKARNAAAAGAVAVAVWDQEGDGAFPGNLGGRDWPVAVLGLGSRQGSALVAALSAQTGLTARITPLPVQPRAVGIASFSSRGPTARGRVKPDLVAPGVDRESAAPTADGAVPEATVITGTSAAAADVASLALRLRLDRPELSALDTRSLLVQAAHAVPNAPPQDVGAGAAGPPTPRPVTIDPPLVSFLREEGPTRVTIALHDLTGRDAVYRVVLDPGDGNPVVIGDEVRVAAGVRRGVVFRVPGGLSPLSGRILVFVPGVAEPVAWAPFVGLLPPPPPSGALGTPVVEVRDGTVEATVAVGRRVREGDSIQSVTLSDVAMWLVPAGGGDPLPVTGEKQRGDWPSGTYRFLVSRRLATGLDVAAGSYRLRVTATAPDGTGLRTESEPFALR